MRISIGDISTRMPTPEDHRAASLSWLRRIQPTLIDQWPSEVMDLSIATSFVKIDVPAVWEGFCGLHEGEPFSPALAGLAADLDDALRWDRKFIRLNSRSPKDYIWPFKVPVTCSGKEAVHMLAGSMRVMDDLMEFSFAPEQPAYVCLREFKHDLKTKEEYRCFVKDRELIAVTHYDYTTPWSGPEDRGVDLRRAINEWFSRRLLPVLHIDTVVFDIHVGRGGAITLIELNPYGSSDPCHFESYEGVENSSEPIKYVPLSEHES